MQLQLQLQALAATDRGLAGLLFADVDTTAAYADIILLLFCRSSCCRTVPPAAELMRARATVSPAAAAGTLLSGKARGSSMSLSSF